MPATANRWAVTRRRRRRARPPRRACARAGAGHGSVTSALRPGLRSSARRRARCGDCASATPRRDRRCGTRQVPQRPRGRVAAADRSYLRARRSSFVGSRAEARRPGAQTLRGRCPA
eukprot:297581-Chlamydomonas_euryale.AAC.1